MVEDDKDDVFFFKRAMQQAGMKNPVHAASDGEQAILYLAGEEQFADRERYPLPVLILLDLKLPRKPGLEVLQWIRERKTILVPVIVFTSSSDERDIKAAYEGGAASYVVKPLGSEERRKFLRLLKDYWFGYNEFCR